MGQPSRQYSVTDYRYGFNGKENDNEVKGEGNQQDYGMRIYDPRLVRFLSTDPLGKRFPFLTPYQYAGNSPIAFVDLDGAEQNYAAFKMMAESIEAEAALYKGNTKDMPFRLQSQLFMLGMAKSASVEGLMYEIDKGLQGTFYNLPSINFNELPPTVQQGLMQQAIDRNSAFGLVSVVKGVGNTISEAANGNPEALGNIAGMILAARMFKMPESELSTTSSGKFLQNARNVAGSSDEVLKQIGDGINDFKELEGVIIEAPKHHIATNKNSISTASGGPWTPKFKEFFDNAGLDINKGPENLTKVVNHKGPHPEVYHQYVFDQLTSATRGLKIGTVAYKNAVNNTLTRIGQEAQTQGSQVNKWLTKQE